MILTVLTLSLVCIFYQSGATFTDQKFHEELFIKPLPTNHVYTFFQFTTLWNTPRKHDTFDHCGLFPRSLGELIARHNVEELHVSLTKGLWSHDLWGYPFVEAPPGAEMYAWINSKRVDHNWKELANGLSGLLCASLNFITTENSMNPEMSFSSESTKVNHTHLRYSTLPREIVCTENLTPWIKLLPCNSLMGLSTLLNRDRIYSTVYHSIGIHFRPIYEDGVEVGMEMKQTLSLVYDLVQIGRKETHWSVQRFFYQGLAPPCPLAETSFVFLDVSQNKSGNPFVVYPADYTVNDVTRGGVTTSLAVFDLKKSKVNNIEVVYKREHVYVTSTPTPPVYLKRFISGYGQENGGLTTRIHNKYWHPIRVVFLENIPWFVSVYFHTLKITSNGKPVKPLKKLYKQGKERQRSYLLELVVELEARSETVVSIEVDFSFLKWQEYPPDANHGFYLGAASLSTNLTSASFYTALPPDKHTIHSLLGGSVASLTGYPVRITTEILILALPTPDFSMPYNVICLACTVVALAFGPLHNITTKKFVIVKVEQKKSVKSVLLSFLKKWLKKFGGETEVEEKPEEVEEKTEEVEEKTEEVEEKNEEVEEKTEEVEEKNEEVEEKNEEVEETKKDR